MKPTRSFRPALEAVENRVVLSFSLSHFFDSIFPGLGSSHTSTPAAPKPAAHHAALPHHSKKA